MVSPLASGASVVALTDIDQDLLKRCLAKKPGAWNDFVDRYLSLIYHAIHYTSHLRSARLSPEDVEDIAAEVLVQIVSHDYRVLRDFKGTASLATYLTVISRRICVHELSRRQAVRDSIRKGETRLPVELPDETAATSKAMDKLEDVEALLRKLGGKDREIVRQFYLEGRTYEEISTELDIPVNSIGSVLTRARAKLRELSKSYTEIQAVNPVQKKSAGKSGHKPKPTGEKPA
jgi:RNA polymerase sigma-70 factor, ECF subfamily